MEGERISRGGMVSAGGGGAALESDDAAAAVREHPRYMAVWGGLAVLTVVELGVAFMGFPRVATIVALLGLALWKALLVALYFMHLRFETTPLRILAAAPLLPAAVLFTLAVFEHWA